METTNQYLTFSEFQLHLRRSGSEGFPIVLLHQTPLSSRMFERVLPYLGQRMQAFAFDTPGYGNSSPLDKNNVNLQSYAHRISLAIEKLGLNQIAIAGFATGSALAITIAQNLGDKVTHLILSGTPLLSEEEIKYFSDNLPEKKIKKDGSHLGAMWNNRINSYGAEGGLDQIQMVIETSLTATGKMRYGLEAVIKDNIEEKLKLLKQKVLFLTLENDKLVSSNKKAALIVKHAREIIVSDSYPQLCWTNPELYADIIFDFVLD